MVISVAVLSRIWTSDEPAWIWFNSSWIRHAIGHIDGDRYMKLDDHYYYFFFV